MNSDNALGCMWVAVIGACVLIFASFAFGAPVITGGGLAWDNSAWMNREAQRTERERIQANRDIAIERERGETVQAFVEVAGQALIIVAIVAGLSRALPPMVASLAGAFAAWAARPHRPVAPPQQIIVMAAPYLEAMREARLEYDPRAGAWVVYSDATETVHYLTDSQA